MNTEKDCTSSSKKTIPVSYIILGVICIVSILGIWVLRYFYHPVVVSGSSMYPTYSNEEILSTNPDFTSSNIKRGSVVYFYSDKLKMHLIKRVSAVPGDRIKIDDGILYVNGKAEDAEFPRIDDPGLFSKESVVPENEYLMLGDNRNHSTDSRKIGLVHYDSIKGIVENRMFAGIFHFYKETFSNERN